MAYADEMARLQRRRQMAQALIQQGAQPQGMQAGRFFVGPSATSGLASLASIIAGGVMDRKLEGKEKTLKETERARLADILRGSISPSGSVTSTQPPGMISESGAVPGSQPQAAPAADPQREALISMLSGMPIEQQQALVGQQAMAKLFPSNKEGFTLGPGQTRYDPSGKEIAARPVGSNSGPASVQEYEYAKANGFNGSFQDWIAAGGQSSRPSAITVFEYFSKLPPEKQQQMLETMRAPVVREIGGVPTIVTGQGGLNPLSTLETESSAAGKLAEGKAVGQAEGEAKGGLVKKGVNAQSVLDSLDIADSLIDVATGSVTGAGYDKVAQFFGGAPDGAKAIASLKVLQANLMTNMPRMEGPQSDRDVQLYREAAGQLGDPTVPRDIKKAAVQTIRQIQGKYKQGSPTSPASTPVGPKRIASDAEFDSLPSGSLFVGPDGQTRRKP